MLNMSGRTSRMRPLWRLAAGQAGQVLLMMALSRASLFADLSPFSVAWFSAALFAGRSPWAMLAGCCLGCPWEVLGLEAVTPLAGCLMVLGLHWVLKKWLLPYLNSGRHGRLGGEDALLSALAGLGALVPPLALTLLKDGVTASLLTAMLSGLVAMAFAPVLRSAAALNARRAHLLSEEILSLTLCAMLCLMGVNASPAYQLAPPLAALVTLACSYAGPTQGAAAGVVAGPRRSRARWGLSLRHR